MRIYDNEVKGSSSTPSLLLYLGSEEFLLVAMERVYPALLLRRRRARVKEHLAFEHLLTNGIEAAFSDILCALLKAFGNILQEFLRTALVHHIPAHTLGDLNGLLLRQVPLAGFLPL